MHNKNLYAYLQDNVHTHIIRDPLWKTIVINKEFVSLLSSPPMQRLHQIRQLGPTYLVYPSATHTRFSHSIGVYHVAKSIMLHLLPQEHCPSLTLSQVNAFLAAALLHDIGHFPYTHSLKELPLPEHETLSAHIIKTQLSDLLRAHHIDPILTAAIIDTSHSNSTISEHDTVAYTLFSQLLSGAMDPDKLDYLCRDAFFTGLPYGIQDIFHAISQIGIHTDGNIYYLSSLPIENILFSKYMMYHHVYWHTQVRSATAMIKAAIHYALIHKDLVPSDLTTLNDNELMTCCDTIQKPYMQLVKDVAQGKIYKEALRYDYSSHFDFLIPLETRQKTEQHIASLIGVPYVVVDVPEHINFETIAHDDQKTQLGNTFDHNTIHKFTTEIRKTRLFVPPDTPPLSPSQTTLIEQLLLPSL